MVTVTKSATINSEAEAFANKSYNYMCTGSNWKSYIQDYYSNVSSWSHISVGKKNEIQSKFDSLEKIESDPKKNDLRYAIELDIWKDVAKIWIENTNTLTAEERKATPDIDSLDHKQAILVSNQLLALYINKNPNVDPTVEGAQYYDYYVDVLKDKQKINDYDTDQHIWWTTNYILYQSWFRRKKEIEMPAPPPLPADISKEEVQTPPPLQAPEGVTVPQKASEKSLKEKAQQKNSQNNIP